MRVCFIGHRTVVDAEQIRIRLFETVTRLIADGADTFLFGSRSDFDSLCWEVVTELQMLHPNLKRVSYNAPHEMSFTSKEERQNFEKTYAHLLGGEYYFKDYEAAVNSQKSQNATRDTYVMRNQEMIDNCDVCVFYYNKDYLPPRRKQSKRDVLDYQPQSGTAVAFTYAKRKKKIIINLFDCKWVIMPICSFISHQPKDFPWKYGKNKNAHAEYIRQLRKAVAVAVKYDEIDTFYCGMTHTADLDFAEAVIYNQESKYPNIQLVCIIAEDPSSDWADQDTERYKAVLGKANDKKTVNDTELSKYLVDYSKRVIFVWNESKSGSLWKEIQYATQQNKLTYFIRLNDIKTDTDEPNGKLKRELKEAEQLLHKAIFTRIGYTMLIKELITEHPNPKAAFKTAIENNPAFKQPITSLADLLELDLSTKI